MIYNLNMPIWLLLVHVQSQQSTGSLIIFCSFRTPARNFPCTITYSTVQAFLLTNLVLTGLPLLFFTAFSIMVFVSSIVVCILLGLFVALLFTTFCVGVGLLFLLPTLFMATMTATFVFTWGLCGYYILTWFNERRRPVDKGGPLDKRLNNRTKGRLSYITGNLNGSGASESNSTFQDNPPVNGDTEAKKQSHVPNDAAKPGEMQDAMEQAWGATSKGGGATGTAAGTEGSTTVLT